MFTIKVIYNDSANHKSVETFDNINDYKKALEWYGIKSDSYSVTIVW